MVDGQLKEAAARSLAETIFYIEQKRALLAPPFNSHMAYQQAIRDTLSLTDTPLLCVKQMVFEASLVFYTKAKLSLVMEKIWQIYGIDLETGVFGLCHPDTSLKAQRDFYRKHAPLAVKRNILKAPNPLTNRELTRLGLDLFPENGQ